MSADIIKIDFEFTTPYGAFRDALYLPVDHGLSESEIEALKQERLNNWIDAIENPPVLEAVENPPIPVIEE